jgi:hypothetical protein
MSMASKPRSAIRWTACSIGSEENAIDEQESRIFHWLWFSARAPRINPWAPVIPTKAAELSRRKLLREYVLSGMVNSSDKANVDEALSASSFVAPLGTNLQKTTDGNR